MTARRPIQKSSKRPRKSCRKSCRSVLRKRAQSWRLSSLPAQPRRRIRPPSSRPRPYNAKGARIRAPFLLVWFVGFGGGPPEALGRARGKRRLIQRRVARAVAARLVLDENLRDLRMPDRLAGLVRQQVLFGDIGDVFGFRVFREQMIERLILVRPDFLRDRQPPFLGIVEFRIDVEDHAPERKDPVADDLSDLEFGGSRFDHPSSNRPGLWPMLEANNEFRPPACCPGPTTKKNNRSHDGRSQSGAAVFRLDLHRICLRQAQETARNGSSLDEFLPALRVVAGAVFQNHVKDAVRGTQQSAVRDRNHTGDGRGVLPLRRGRAADRPTVDPRSDHGGLLGRLPEYWLHAPRARARRAWGQGGGSYRVDLLLRQHPSVFDCTPVYCT